MPKILTHCPILNTISEISAQICTKCWRVFYTQEAHTGLGLST